MELGICCNFGPPHCGGSEQVIENISTRLIERYGYNITIFGNNYKRKEIYKGINLCPCLKGDQFVSQIANLDSLMVYSDSQWNMDNILNNIKKIDCGLSLALVGGYHMRSHPAIFELLKKNIDKFNLITHSKVTPDYKWCIDNELPVKVVPNGINTSEFSENSINFRKKYNIKKKYIILNLSNMFYGKGFDILPKIYQKLSNRLDDFIFLQLSNSVKYPYDQIFLNRTKQQCNGMNIRFLRDLPREDVVASFKESDIFLFTSKKEVCPLVILESRAAKLPWVSMDVGNTIEQPGGIVISNQSVDYKGYKIVDDKIVDNYVGNIIKILKDKDMRDKLITEGQKDIEEIDWDNIVPLYNEVFRG